MGYPDFSAASRNLVMVVVAVMVVAKVVLSWVLAPRYGPAAVAAVSLGVVVLTNIPGFAVVLYLKLKRGG